MLRRDRRRKGEKQKNIVKTGRKEVWIGGWVDERMDGLKEVVIAGKGGREEIEMEEIGSEGLG